MRALRYRGALWAPFRATVCDWLEAWRPAGHRLLLVGPSAGHTLPVELLRTRFTDITACEPDPLARHWLRRRLHGIRFCSAARLDAAGLAALATEHPDAAILFCNVLGQLPPPATGWTTALAPLARHDWASFHDLLSTTRPADCHCAGTGEESSLDKVAARYWRGGVLELTDHQTIGLGDPLTRRHTLWRLTPRHWHVIGWGCHAPNEA